MFDASVRRNYVFVRASLATTPQALLSAPDMGATCGRISKVCQRGVDVSPSCPLY